MSTFEKIISHFNLQLDAISGSIEGMTAPTAEAAELITNGFIEGHKVICCTSANAIPAGREFSQQLLFSPRIDRPGLPAIFLEHQTTLPNHFPDEIFSKQVIALGEEGDILLLFSGSGNEKYLSSTIDAATFRKMKVVLCSAGKSTDLTDKMPPDGIAISLQQLPDHVAQLLQFMLGQLLPELIETQLFGIST